MPRKVQSQWDFGELFGPQQTRQVWTVSELTQRVKRLLEPQFASIWVKGEVSNLRSQPSGHIYFTLKDAGAQLACVLFRGETGVARQVLADGQQVLVRGELTVYEPRGQYQLVVRELEPVGLGALQAALERLKQKLQAEGLFEVARKRRLPVYVYRVGVVTSPAGAAYQDVLSVWRRRYAGMEIILAPCRVQGEGAAAEIAAAIAGLNAWHAAQPAGCGLHALLVTRGGGSLEDLWAFNEEVVARAIFHSAVPVVSAVGHEIDFTISDLVADVRAPTPSAAAELLSEGMFRAGQAVPGYAEHLRRSMGRRFMRLTEALQQREARLERCHPRRRLEQQSQRLDDLLERLLRQPRRQWQAQQAHLARLVQQVQRQRPARWLARRTEQWTALRQRLSRGAEQQVQERQRRVQQWLEQLRLLSPQHTLERGYSITRDAATGRILRRADETAAGREVITRLAHGEVVSRVEETRAAEPADPLLDHATPEQSG
ncbi:MAG: exodeoxyribonuclease VII large subunit [Verrucomicrobiae bacterium]|nr:exodeoxyribonuclease VII large subunit [Verrucomicrobiae bacterium]